jgi:hypothetical protein
MCSLFDANNNDFVEMDMADIHVSEERKMSLLKHLRVKSIHCLLPLFGYDICMFA